MILLNSYEALGTKCFIEIFDTKINNFEIIQREIIKEIENFENLYSRFLPNSLISNLNKTKSIENPPEDLLHMLILSKFYFEKTKGIFNICNGHILENRGYGQIFESNPTQFVKSFEIEINKDLVMISPQVKIDLGGIGKGYLIQKISDILKNRFKIEFFLINFGGDIYLTSDNNKEIEIFMENPFESCEFFGSVKMINKSLAASSPYKRFWKYEDKRYSHIFDNSELEIENSSFVFSKDIIEADVLATTLCINPNLEYEFNDISFIVVDGNGQIIKVR